MPILRKAYVVLWAANRFLGSETPKRNDFEQFWKFKFHFEHFPRNTQDVSFDHQGSARRHLTSTILKLDFVQTLNTFWSFITIKLVAALARSLDQFCIVLIIYLNEFLPIWEIVLKNHDWFRSVIPHKSDFLEVFIDRLHQRL